MRNDATGTRDAAHERAANVMSQAPDRDERELRRLRSEVAAQERAIHDLDDREHRQETLIARLRREAAMREGDLAVLGERLEAAEHELEDLRAIRDALTPPELPQRPGLELAAAFLPAPPKRSAATFTWWLRGRRIPPCWSSAMSLGTACRRGGVRVRTDGVRRDRPLLR